MWLEPIIVHQFHVMLETLYKKSFEAGSMCGDVCALWPQSREATGLHRFSAHKAECSTAELEQRKERVEPGTQS